MMEWVRFEPNGSTSENQVMRNVALNFSCLEKTFHGKIEQFDTSSALRKLIRVERKFFLNCLEISKKLYSGVAAKNFPRACQISLE